MSRWMYWNIMSADLCPCDKRCVMCEDHLSPGKNSDPIWGTGADPWLQRFPGCERSCCTTFNGSVTINTYFLPIYVYIVLYILVRVFICVHISIHLQIYVCTYIFLTPVFPEVLYIVAIQAAFLQELTRDSLKEFARLEEPTLLRPLNDSNFSKIMIQFYHPRTWTTSDCGGFKHIHKITYGKF